MKIEKLKNIYNIENKQIYLINKAKSFLRKLEKEKINTAKRKLRQLMAEYTSANISQYILTKVMSELFGYFITSQRFAKYFQEQGHGNIVNIGSIY